LRELATQLKEVVRAAPCRSVAYHIVANCCDHLEALAAAYERESCND
jgi:hypothetical protein